MPNKSYYFPMMKALCHFFFGKGWLKILENHSMVVQAQNSGICISIQPFIIYQNATKKVKSHISKSI